MFEFITNREDRGQVGIGTLIVFIAMVLVAAIAAGVLINTAGFLQTQAEATGEESTDLVSERIDVMSEVGIVGNPSPGELSEIRLGVSGAPGADQIDLTETTIQAVGPGGQENLVFTSSASGASEVTQLSVPSLTAGDSSVSVTVNYDNIDSFSAGDSSQKLVVEYDSGGDGTVDETTEVTATDFSSQQINFAGDGTQDNTLSASLSQGDDVSFDLVDTSNSDQSVLEETATQTVDPVQFTIDAVVDGDTSFDVSFNYDNIDSLTDANSEQELLIEVDEGNTGSTDVSTTVTSTDLSDPVTITADGDGSSATGVSATGGTFSTDDVITVTLSDGTGTQINSGQQSVVASGGSPVDVIDNDPAEATAVFSNKVANLGPNEFAIGSDGNFRTSAVLNEEKDFTILINPDAGALKDTNANEAFGESDSATLDIVSPAGATTSVELRAPDLFNNKGEAVRL